VAIILITSYAYIGKCLKHYTMDFRRGYRSLGIGKRRLLHFFTKKVKPKITLQAKLGTKVFDFYLVENYIYPCNPFRLK
jgi:hypothetical protein